MVIFKPEMLINLLNVLAFAEIGTFWIMIRIAVLAFAFTLLCFGVWDLCMSMQYASRGKDWPSVDGWLCEHGEGLQLPGRLHLLNLFLAQPYVGFVYFVDGKMYYERQELPTCLLFVCPAPTNKALGGSPEELDYSYLETSSHQLARFKPETRKLEILTEEGMTISSNYGTSHLGQKWGEVPQSEWDAYLPRVSVQYNRSNPQESVTVPDQLNGSELLMKSGVTAILGAVIVAGAVFFHAWVTRPSPEPDLQQGRRY